MSCCLSGSILFKHLTITHPKSYHRILEKLGEGGMGVVYKAEDLKLKRAVALKFLPARTVLTDEDRERFAREAQLAASLLHPNIATIHEFDEVQGQAFLAMEYIEGQTLAKKVQKQPLTVDEFITIAVATADGLAVAKISGRSQITGRTLNTARQYLRLVKDFHPELKVVTGEPQAVKLRVEDKKKRNKH